MNNPGIRKPNFNGNNPLGNALKSISALTTKQLSVGGGMRTLGFGDRLAITPPPSPRKTIPNLYWCQYRTSSGTIPQYSVLEIYQYNPTLDVYYVRRPTGDSKSQVVFTGVVNEYEYSGDYPSIEMTLNFFNGGIPVKYNGTAPTIGDEVGTVANQWYVQKGKYGLLVLGVDTTRGLCFVRPFNAGLLKFNITAICIAPTSTGELTAENFSSGAYFIPGYNPSSAFYSNSGNSSVIAPPFHYPLRKKDFQFGYNAAGDVFYSSALEDVFGVYTRDWYKYGANPAYSLYTIDGKGRKYYSLDEPPTESDIAIGAWRYMSLVNVMAREDGLSSDYFRLKINDDVIQDSFTEDRSGLSPDQQTPNYGLYRTYAGVQYIHDAAQDHRYASQSGIYCHNRAVAQGDVWNFKTTAMRWYGNTSGRPFLGVKAFLLDLRDCSENPWGKLIASSDEVILEGGEPWSTGDVLDVEFEITVPEDYEG